MWVCGGRNCFCLQFLLTGKQRNPTGEKKKKKEGAGKRTWKYVAAYSSSCCYCCMCAADCFSSFFFLFFPLFPLLSLPLPFSDFVSLAYEKGGRRCPLSLFSLSFVLLFYHFVMSSHDKKTNRSIKKL